MPKGIGRPARKRTIRRCPSVSGRVHRFDVLPIRDKVEGKVSQGSQRYALGRSADHGEFVLQRRAAILASVPGFLNGSLDLLDIGCGSGAMTLAVSGMFRYCYGIDIDPESISSAKRTASARGITNCTFSKVDIDHPPPRDRRFARVVCFEVLEHVRSDASAAALIFDALEPRGMAVVSVPNKWWVFETHGANLPLLPWNRVPFFSWLPTSVHERYAKARIYTKSRVEHLLIEAGLVVKRSYYLTAPMDRVPWKALREWLRRSVLRMHTTRCPFLSTSILVVVSRPG